MRWTPVAMRRRGDAEVDPFVDAVRPHVSRSSGTPDPRVVATLEQRQRTERTLSPAEKRGVASMLARVVAWVAGLWPR